MKITIFHRPSKFEREITETSYLPLLIEFERQLALDSLSEFCHAMYIPGQRA